MGVTNLGRVQGGGFYYADYTPSEADSSIRLGRVWLKPNTVKALIGDHVVMADGSLWEITALSDGEADLVMTLERKTSIRGKKGDTGAQGEAGIGCSINGVPTALDFTSNPQSQLNDLKQQNTSQSSQIENLGQADQNLQSQIDVLKKLYGVGSIYMSTNYISPAMLFGGTWEEIKDRFLLAAGDSYSAGATGGEVNHTLTINEMPTHTHEYYRMKSGGTTWWVAGSSGTIFDQEYTITNSSGGGQAHNNMPPYLAVYIWKRTA